MKNSVSRFLGWGVDLYLAEFLTSVLICPHFHKWLYHMSLNVCYPSCGNISYTEGALETQDELTLNV